MQILSFLLRKGDIIFMCLTLVLGVDGDPSTSLEMSLTPEHGPRNFNRTKTQRVGRYHQLHLCALVHGPRWHQYIFLLPFCQYFSHKLGWRFMTPNEDLPGENVVPDPLNGVQNIREL